MISCDKDCSGNPFAQRQKVGAKSLAAIAIDSSMAMAGRPKKLEILLYDFKKTDKNIYPLGPTETGIFENFFFPNWHFKFDDRQQSLLCF